MTLRKTLTANRGETFKLSVRYLDENRAPINLDSYSARFTLADSHKDAVAAGYGGILTTTDGWLHLTVNATDTLNWPASSTYVVAVELNGEVTWLVTGTLNVTG